MRIKELLRKYLNSEDPDIEISVLLPKDLLKHTSIALESFWQNSGRKDWMYRVDPEDPRIPLMRHIHIAKEKHKSSKNMQASWNSDGTRHDKKSFNDNVGNTKIAREIARQILGIPDNVALESFEGKSVVITEEVSFSINESEVYIKFLITE